MDESKLWGTGEVQSGVECMNPLAIGELRVYNTRNCVDISWWEGHGDVWASHCDGNKDQQMILCGDGTIRNEALNYCLQGDQNGQGDIYSRPCNFLGDMTH